VTTAPRAGRPDDDDRIAAAFAASEKAAAAERWLASDRPEELQKFTRALTIAYHEVEHSSPPDSHFGALSLSNLKSDNALCATWPAATLVLRQLMLVASRLYRSLGVTVAGCGIDLTASMPVVGRALQETVSLVDWLTRPLAAEWGCAAAGHLVGCRAFLLQTAGTLDLLRESRDFAMSDTDELSCLLVDARRRATELFGETAQLSKDDARTWSIDGEVIPGPTRRVESTGAYLFSGGSSATHYHGPSMSAHGSLGASLGEYIYIDHGDRSHHAFVLQSAATEKWLWYYTVWYRFGIERTALTHGWNTRPLRPEDAAATRVFGRSVAPSVR
jgi:hypothetical protein